MSSRTSQSPAALARIAEAQSRGDLGAAIDLCQQLVAQQPADWRGHDLLGQLQGNAGRHAASEASFRRAVALDETASEAVLNLARSLEVQRKLAESAHWAQRFVLLQPNSAAGFKKLGALLHRIGRNELAGKAFRRWTELAPDAVDAHTSLGTMLQLTGDHAGARTCYEDALEIDPDNADAMSNLGSVYRAQRDLTSAIAQYQRALATRPGHADAIAGMASALEMQGKYAEALTLVEPVAARDGSSVELALMHAKLLRRTGAPAKAVEVLEARLTGAADMDKDRSRLLFTLGDIHDDTRDYAAAMRAYEQANQLKRIRYNAAMNSAAFARVMRVCTRDGLAQMPRAEPRAPRQVFIVGMPRSGTSLLEQILSCHPEVGAAGEMEELNQLAVGLGQLAGTGGEYPECMAGIGPETLTKAADLYRRRIVELAGDAPVVTDKMPGNFVHLGLVELLFPDASVIHCTRNPLDNCLSLFFQDFAGFSMPFSYALEDVGRYYTDYRRIVAHWKTHSSLRIMDVAYEDMVADCEKQSRAVCEFLDIPWDDRCLDFHASERVALTASNAQVRQPIYSKSVGRHANYAPYLGHLRDVLALD